MSTEILKSKALYSKEWGELVIQIVHYKTKGMYEIQFSFNCDGEQTTMLCELYKDDEQGLEWINKAFADYDLGYAEYTAACSYQAGLIQEYDPNCIPVL
ncbi:hypothetical protein GZ77_07285 [Endozoicomonas montiporae]|uniref:Uncharacterized protein n=2 Tax=Endozoicomonas montiporae TaxID=1027273 RepID=A0A081N6Z6_9GAMM|nr:hypothetical protein [Endozoicomonas montiporae]AMO55973.1 hypothetical protein EZMO1_1830 [Endozoicomonas montiporae CL-33]KEQ14219.1 hypothetical protein GZ77_07285 [Endozoicomonas montiporae]